MHVYSQLVVFRNKFWRNICGDADVTCLYTFFFVQFIDLIVSMINCKTGVCLLILFISKTLIVYNINVTCEWDEIYS